MYNIRGYKRRIRKRGLKVIVTIVLLCVVRVFRVCSMIVRYLFCSRFSVGGSGRKL